MRLVHPIWLLAAALLPACTLPRAAIGTLASDATPADEDAAVPIDAASPDDAYVPDAAVIPDTGPPCTPLSSMETQCDRVDEDCDGVVDDDDVCRCTAFSALGHGYLSCPGPIDGFAAWSGACGRNAPGYDLVVFSDVTEQRAVLAAMTTLRIADAHWIGLNDFEANATYVWRDRSTSFVPLSISGDDPAKRFVAMGSDGSYQASLGTEVHRFLCEPVLAPGACRGTSEPTTCDGIDDDCDGVPDDGVPCGASMCAATPFWDHVYYLCARTRHQDEATAECMRDTGGPLTSIDDSTEHAFLARLSPNEAWIGLDQDLNAGAVTAGWHWLDGSMGYGVPVVAGVPWDPGEPNDSGDGTENNQENCGLLLSTARGSHFDDRACGAGLPFLCERPWMY